MNIPASYANGRPLPAGQGSTRLSEGLGPVGSPCGRTFTRVKQAFLLAVLGASCLPLLGLILNVHVKADLRTENRRPAEFPTFAWRAVADGSYFTQFESYFNDHFGFRELVIQKKHEFDWLAFRRVRPDLVCGRDHFIFYKFIAEVYRPEQNRQFPKEFMVDLITRLNEKLARKGIRLVIVQYPNKELIYHDKLPSYWQVESDPEQLRFCQAVEALGRSGIPVVALHRDFFALKEREQVFTEVEENHCSPPALFLSMQRILETLSREAKVAVDIPQEFPRVVSDHVEAGKGYRAAQHVNSNYGCGAPWSFYRPGSTDGYQHFYFNPKGALPSTTVFTDSFLMTLTQEFGSVFLPFFQEFVMDYKTFNPDSITSRTCVVILAFSDQLVWLLLPRFQELLNRVN
jgi:hypothetical protein